MSMFMLSCSISSQYVSRCHSITWRLISFPSHTCDTCACLEIHKTNVPSSKGNTLKQNNNISLVRATRSSRHVSPLDSPFPPRVATLSHRDISVISQTPNCTVSTLSHFPFIRFCFQCFFTFFSSFSVSLYAYAHAENLAEKNVEFLVPKPFAVITEQHLSIFTWEKPLNFAPSDVTLLHHYQL